MKNRNEFFKYVIPSIFSFALAGVYSIVDGFFVGNSIGDAGLSAINIAYPIVAMMQSLGTGIGMGGAVHYSIHKASGDEKHAKEYAAAVLWLLIIGGILLTFGVYAATDGLLGLLGAQGQLLELGSEYIHYIAIGAILQIMGTGLVPLMRNYGGSFWAMIAMICGFVTNIVLDYLFIWVLEYGMRGAAVATVIGQGVTMLIALLYCGKKRSLYLRLSPRNMGYVCGGIFKIGLAPFGLALTPEISLIIINRFSIIYGGDQALAVYACISYIICVIYLILQGVGDGSQPLMSRCYGAGDKRQLRAYRRMAYIFAVLLALAGVAVLFLCRNRIGTLFGTSPEVNEELGRIMPIFLISVPFVAVTRIGTAAFYATEKSLFSYILTFIEPVFMLVLMLLLPPLFGGQLMVWWCTVFARILTAALSVVLTVVSAKRT